jgi:hypothetical protein
MVRTHLPGPCRNEWRAASASPTRKHKRVRLWAWMVSLLLVAPALAEEPAPDSAPVKAAAVVKTADSAPVKDPSVVKGAKTVKKKKKKKDVKKSSTNKASTAKVEVQVQTKLAGSEEGQEFQGKSDGGKLLDRPLDPIVPSTVPSEDVPPDFAYKMEPPLGFTGRSSVIPTVNPSVDFVPIEDRWRLGWPEYDRYDRGHALPDDYPYILGKWWSPYNQNVLKGDFPVIGQNTFLTLTAKAITLVDSAMTPVGTGAFESTARPNQAEFFGNNTQLFTEQYYSFSFDLSHGDAGFKQPDWRIKVTPIFNVNTVNANELAFVNPNVTAGTQRDRSFLAMEEYFVEAKLADLSPEYDTLSVRVGSQDFTSDFRGFLFSETNRAVRLFGSAQGNSLQYNLVYVRPAEKETDSALNSYQDRGQNIFIANFYRQDFIWPGYTVSGSIHYNNDPASTKFNNDSFRVRPDNAGTFQPHSVDAVYFGLASDGHIERYNLTTQLYYVCGYDSQNAIANTGQDIRAGMAAVELSYDRDWARFRTSFFWASGDENPNNHHATGFDTIFDEPNFAGGEFSFWQHQGIGLFAVNLKNNASLIPSLNSSKIQGQSNFVNPGLVLFNLGADFDITPKLKLVHNTNFLWFQSTEVLKTFLFDGHIDNRIGTDMSIGLEYRPLATNNIQFKLGVATLIPGSGFQSLYANKNNTLDPLVAAFFQSVFQY